MENVLFGGAAFYVGFMWVLGAWLFPKTPGPQRAANQPDTVN